MDIVTLSLAKAFALSVSSGFSNVSVSGTTITFTLNDGVTTAQVTVPTPADGEDGVSIVDVDIDANKHLIVTLSDGNTVDAGALPIPSAGNIPIITSTASTYSTALDADRFYSLGELTSFYLNLASTSDSNLHEYMFEFKSGITPTTFTYDSENITLVNVDFTPVANKTYQGSVVNGICIIIGV